MEQQSNAESSKNVSEEELMELAKKELLRDTKCASMRAEQFGAHSWAKPQKYVPSKRFLRQMLVTASRDNLRKNYKYGRNKSSRFTSVPVGKVGKVELLQDVNTVMHSEQSDANLRKSDKYGRSKSSRVTSAPREESKKSDSSVIHRSKKLDHPSTKNKRQSRWDSSEISSYSRSKDKGRTDHHSPGRINKKAY